MIVVVFGATGFVGHNLVRRLAELGREVVAVSRSGAKVPEATRSLSMDALGDVVLPEGSIVFHVAAQRYDASNFDMAQSDILTSNVELSNRVYAFCARTGVKEVRLASSVAVYQAGLPNMDDATPIDLHLDPYPNEAFYGWSKRWGEILARLYRDKYGISTVAFRLSNPYGPFDSTQLTGAHVLPAFVMRALQPGDAFVIKGDPLVERDFIFVDDVTSAMAATLDWRGRSETFNLCRGETTTLLSLAEAILAVSGSDKRIETDAEFAPAAVRIRSSTADRVKSAFAIDAFTSLEDGLRPTIDWYRENSNA